MNRLNFTHVAMLMGIIGLFLSALTPCVAQEGTTTFSGRVLNMEGEPIAGFTIALPPAMMDRGQLVRPHTSAMYPALVTSKTDENGAFAFNNVMPGPVQIVIPAQQPEGHEMPERHFEPDYEIVSVKIGGMMLYPVRHPLFGNITFAVTPGGQIENVEVTVRPRMRIRARVVFSNGEPLVNARLRLNTRRQGVDNGGSGSSSSGVTTDAEGYFVYYVDNDKPVRYTVSVAYKGLSATSEPLLIEKGTRYDGLILTLDGDAPATVAPPVDSTVPKNGTHIEIESEPVAPATTRTPPTAARDSLPDVLRKLTGARTPPDSATPGRTNRPGMPGDGIAWVVNPQNGHAYKKIRCKSLKDAQARADAEGAYLVAINDEAEQRWLLGFFGNHLYWLGLSDAEEEGQWRWQNGEPLTYTNWGAKHRFPRSTLSAEEKDAAVMTFVDGAWHAVGPGDFFWSMTRQALLEKDDVHTGAE